MYTHEGLSVICDDRREKMKTRTKIVHRRCPKSQKSTRFIARGRGHSNTPDDIMKVQFLPPEDTTRAA